MKNEILLAFNNFFVVNFFQNYGNSTISTARMGIKQYTIRKRIEWTFI